MPQALPTPHSVRKLYRYVLRHAAAAVLFEAPEMPNLRALYRPEFDVWMSRAKEPEAELLKDREEWEEFARRVQNTLFMLRQSSEINDLPCKVTKNLANLKYYLDPPLFVQARSSTKTLSTAAMSRPEFLPLKQAKRSAEIEKLYAWDGLAQLVGMAEGSTGLLLGKIRPRPPTPKEEEEENG